MAAGGLVGAELAPPLFFAPLPPIPRPLPPTPRKRREGEPIAGRVFSFPPCGGRMGGAACGGRFLYFVNRYQRAEQAPPLRRVEIYTPGQLNRSPIPYSRLPT